MKNAFRFIVAEFTVYKCRTGYAVAAVGPPINMAGDITSPTAIRRKTITSVHKTPEAAVLALNNFTLSGILESTNSDPVPDPYYTFEATEFLDVHRTIKEMQEWTTKS